MRAPRRRRRAKMAAVFAGSPWPESRRALIARRLLCICFATLLWTLAPAGSALALGGGGVGGFGGGGGGGGGGGVGGGAGFGAGGGVRAGRSARPVLPRGVVRVRS